MVSIIVQRRPFNSPESGQLIPKLDAELSELYPDWSSLPNPGDDVGLKGRAPELNPKPKDTSTVSILNDAEPNPINTNTDTDQPPEHDESLIFFVAYLSSPGTDDDNDHPNEPVGCMAVKVEKYYPHHHPPEMYLDTLQDQIQRDITHEATTKTAQLKRLFVEKAYRSTKMQPSVAVSLLEHCEKFAKNNMHVKRLVVETGTRQIGAIKLYQRAGYTQVANFGDYACTSVERGGVSVCFAKML